MTVAAQLSALPPASRRAIALGGMLLALVLIWLLVISPLEALASSQYIWRQEVALQIARDRGMAESAKQIHAVSGVVRNAAIRARLFESSSIGVENQLQNDLRKALQQSGVESTNFKVLPGKRAEGLRQYRVEFSSIMSVDQLRAFFAQLAHQSRYVRIERLQVNAPESQRPDENPKLTILMEAQGFALDSHSDVPVKKVAYAN